MQELNDFSAALLGHIANESKPNRAVVDARYQSWNARKDLSDNDEFYGMQYYNYKIEQPRNIKIETHAEYLQEKKRLWEEWKRARQADKLPALVRVMQLQVPALIKDGVDTCSIYTKNISIL